MPAAFLPTSTVTATAAEPCPDAELVFARGTNQPPGLGVVGSAFFAALRSQLADKTVTSYAVNYPASYNLLRAGEGANDTVDHVQQLIAACPTTRIVLGGYSQGAAVIDMAVGSPVPGFGLAAPLAPQDAEHIGAVAVFGNPYNRIGHTLTESPVYGAKTIDLCADGDPICSDGIDRAAHSMYSPGLTRQAAAFVAGVL
ncbi:cutinase family protein [Mycolicibacter acidiphilus]|uniref:cutinase family protein n=1 Tax=Mycolicibacter acidiphilus TaxID=2835306 RepID=UPI0027DBC983|nr:cutinase family protein [Mycolicibacter acidiphilus]